MTRKLFLLQLCLLSACASKPFDPPYPSYINVDELPDTFVAGLPGVRAKQLSIDPRTQRVSYRVDVPPDWTFTTGAAPLHSLEIFVLAGEIRIGEFTLEPGGYIYIPPAMSGVQMSSTGGAQMLQISDEANDAAVIQTPIIASSELLDWEAVDIGLSVKELRKDPGSGARTWLMKVDPEAMIPFQVSNRNVEGYLVSGSVHWSECADGILGTDLYQRGGYFHRPPGAIHGGPETVTDTGAVWYLRVLGEEQVHVVDDCSPGE